MKKKLSFILGMVMCLSIVLGINAPVLAAESWPTLSASAYCEFTAAKQINVYKDTACKTRGTSSPAKKYNASIASGDVCYIYKITSSYIQANYPTSSGRRTGYIKRSDFISKSTPTEVVTSKGKATTYASAGGKTYGNIAKDDKVYTCGTKDGYTAVIYTAKSGKRAFKFGWVKTSDYTSVIQKGTEAKAEPNTNKNANVKTSDLLFPLKGSISRSSSVKTNGYYCDYKTGGSKPVYAPADGTVVYKQAYRNRSGSKKLSSYGNFVEFTSSDGIYKVKCCHLDSFNGVGKTVTSSLSYPCSGSDGTLTLKTKTVKQGELLGYSGHTGNASGHHLHLEVKKKINNKYTPVAPTSVFTEWK